MVYRLCHVYRIWAPRLPVSGGVQLSRVHAVGQRLKIITASSAYQKTSPSLHLYFFLNNFVKNQPILIICGIRHPELTWNVVIVLSIYGQCICQAYFAFFADKEETTNSYYGAPVFTSAMRVSYEFFFISRQYDTAILICHFCPPLARRGAWPLCSTYVNLFLTALPLDS